MKSKTQYIKATCNAKGDGTVHIVGNTEVLTEVLFQILLALHNDNKDAVNRGAITRFLDEVEA